MSEAETLRLDIWLWRARFFKARSDAMDHISKRGVRITRDGQVRRVSKPAAQVAIGDLLSFSRGRQVFVLEILGLPERRGPASEAQAHYMLLQEDRET